VRIQEHDETKFLGPSSGIAITRLVMQLAKQFTDAKSISDIITQNEAQEVKLTFDEEGDKPTSKIYPMISDVAAEELPQRDLLDLLVRLFNCKGKLTHPPHSQSANHIQSEQCIPSSTNPPWHRMLRTYTTALKTLFRISPFAWSSPSVYSEWTRNTPVSPTVTILLPYNTLRRPLNQ